MKTSRRRKFVKHWPTLLQWIFIFVLASWVTVTVCTGVVISIFCRVVRMVVVPSILIAFLAGQPVASESYLSTHDASGDVTLVPQTSHNLKDWVDHPVKLLVRVNKATMVGSSATIYSNSVVIANFELEPPGTNGVQVVDVSPWINLRSLGTGSVCMVRWRIPVHEVNSSASDLGPDSIFIVVTCGVAVLVIGGISIYHIVKMCNRINGTNAPPAGT